MGGQCFRRHQEKVPLQINSHKTKLHIRLLDTMLRKQPNSCFTRKFIWFNTHTLRLNSTYSTRKKPTQTKQEFRSQLQIITPPLAMYQLLSWHLLPDSQLPTFIHLAVYGTSYLKFVISGGWFKVSAV